MAVKHFFREKIRTFTIVPPFHSPAPLKVPGLVEWSRNKAKQKKSLRKLRGRYDTVGRVLAL